MKKMIENPWLNTTKKRQRELDDAVASLGCIICGQTAEIHHCYGLQYPAKRDPRPRIPLCPRHHRLGGRGVAIHAGKKSFESNFGEQETLLCATLSKLECLEITKGAENVMRKN